MLQGPLHIKQHLYGVLRAQRIFDPLQHHVLATLDALSTFKKIQHGIITLLLDPLDLAFELGFLLQGLELTQGAFGIAHLQVEFVDTLLQQ